MISLARSVFVPRFILINALLLTVATGCEARTRESRPGARVEKGALPAKPLREEGTGGSGQLQSVADLVDAVKGTVVNVDVQARANAEDSGQLFEHFFGGEQGGPAAAARREHPAGRRARASSSMPGGLVLTNNHVVEDADLHPRAAR